MTTKKKTYRNEKIYQTFPDGWDFTPDVGNGQVRGEIFTPYFIVQKMIADSTMLPEKVVYDGDYSGFSKQELERYITRRVIEPAIGTANFSSTILYHKIKLAMELANQHKKDFDTLLLMAVSSMYANDIDYGNVEVSKRRMININTEDITDDSVVDFWVNSTIELMSDIEDIDRGLLRNNITQSLEKAQENWGGFLNDGLIPKLYKEYTGKNMCNKLVLKVKNIYNSNYLVFNGIEKEGSTEDYIVPGWKKVVWKWWYINSSEDIYYTPNPMIEQILGSKIISAEKEASKLMDTHCINGEWEDKKKKKEYTTLMKNIESWKNELEESGEH